MPGRCVASAPWSKHAADEKHIFKNMLVKDTKNVSNRFKHDRMSTVLAQDHFYSDSLHLHMTTETKVTGMRMNKHQPSR